MPRYTPRRTENLVLMYYKPPMKYKRLEMILKSKGIFVSDKTIKNIIDGKGKKRETELRGEVYKKYQPRTKSIANVLKSINKQIFTENPLSQRLIAKHAKVSQSTVNRIIKNDLEKERRMKTSVHVLNKKDMENRKSNSRKLYENHLAGEKCKFVVTLDESWIRLKIDGGKSSFFTSREEKRYLMVGLNRRELFGKGNSW